MCRHAYTQVVGKHFNEPNFALDPKAHMYTSKSKHTRVPTTYTPPTYIPHTYLIDTHLPLIHTLQNIHIPHNKHTCTHYTENTHTHVTPHHIHTHIHRQVELSINTL